MLFRKPTIFCLAIANVFSWSIIFHFTQAKGLEICFLDVGMGDAIFIETGFGSQILIDGGPNDSVLQRLEAHMPFWDRTIDLIVLTHPDRDHLFGLTEVLERYRVGNILWTGIKTDTLLGEQWEEAIGQEGAKIWIAEDSLKIKISENQGLDILYPFESLEGREVSNKNNTSVVMLLNSNGRKILLTGDAEKQAEAWLVEKDFDLRAQILKVSHHGSRTGSSMEFLEAVGPEAGVICAGADNQYGLPAPETLANLTESGITILQTSNYKKDICLIQKRSKPFSLSSRTR